jgi:hypothetical protein
MITVIKMPHPVIIADKKNTVPGKV